MNAATVDCQLHKAFVVPYSRYCSAVWYFCEARNRPKLENLSKRSLRPGCSGRESKSLHYLELLSKFNRSDLYSTKTLWIQFLRQSTHVVVFKWDILNATYGSRKFVIPYFETTTYGLHSFSYISANMWNKLTEETRDKRQDLFYSAQFYRTFRLNLQRQLNTVKLRNKRKKKNVTIN